VSSKEERLVAAIRLKTVKENSKIDYEMRKKGYTSTCEHRTKMPNILEKTVDPFYFCFT